MAIEVLASSPRPWRVSTYLPNERETLPRLITGEGVALPHTHEINSALRQTEGTLRQTAEALEAVAQARAIGQAEIARLRALLTGTGSHDVS